MEILELSASGFIAKEVAAQLGYSSKSVEEHWRRMYRKCNRSSRHEIIAEVLAAALLRLPIPGLDECEESAALRDLTPQ